MNKLEDALSLIENFRLLENGWIGIPECEKIDQLCIEGALALTKQIYTLGLEDILYCYPTPEGGVVFEGSHIKNNKEISYDVEVFTDEEFQLMEFVDNEDGRLHHFETLTELVSFLQEAFAYREKNV